MGSKPDVFDWASVVLSNNYMKTISHEDRNELLHSMLEPYEITIIADRDKIILDGPWGNILKSKVKLSEYFLEINIQPQTIESNMPMESSTLADVMYEEILTSDALEISNEETLAETLSVYETAMLLKHHSSVDLHSNEHALQKTNATGTSKPQELTSVPAVSGKLVEDNSNPLGHESLPTKVTDTKAPLYQGKDPSEPQSDNVSSLLSDDEKELYITIALSSHTDDFQNVIERLGRPATLNLDEITDEILYANGSFKSLALEKNTRPSHDVSKEKQKPVVAVNRRVYKKNTSRHKTPKDERGYRITRKDRVKVVGGSPNNVLNKAKEQMLGSFKFSCDKCSLKTNQRNYYVKHMQLHDKNPELLSCNRCDYKTVGRTSLGRHKKQHASLKLSCELCNYRTNEEMDLENHKMKKHKERERIYECTHCDYTTAAWYQIKRHVQEHVLSEEVVFRCQQCPYTSLFKTQISRHIKTVHLNVRQFLCDTCGRKFKRPDSLKAHAYLHGPVGQKKFPCPVCAKVCVTSAYLASHMVSHSKERPFLCEICGASFKMQGTQRKHMAIVHRNPGRFSCDNCGRKFNRKFTLLRHTKTHRPCGSVKDGSHTQNRQILPVPLLGSDQIAVIGQTDQSLSFSGETTVMLRPDSARVVFESQATLTVMEGQLDGTTMAILTEVDEAYDAASQGETATALLYLTNN